MFLPLSLAKLLEGLGKMRIFLSLLPSAPRMVHRPSLLNMTESQ